MPRTQQKQPTKPHLQLVGTDGNAFAILGAAIRAARRAGWTKQQRDTYVTAATAGDYDHLLAVTMDHFDVH